MGYALETDAGKYFDLRFATPPKAAIGERIAVVGEVVARNEAAPRAVDHGINSQLIEVESIEQIGPAGDLGTVQQPLATGGPRTFKPALVLLNFAGISPQPFTREDATQRIAKVAAYYDEISYGNWKIEGDVFGPYTVPKPNDCSFDTILPLARQEARNSGVDIDAYEHVAAILPHNETTGLSCVNGAAYQGTSPATPMPEVKHDSVFTDATDANGFAHEWGHAFGLAHSSSVSCGGVAYKRDGYKVCQVNEYGNNFNTMGSGLGHMNAFQKATMKWLDDCNNLLVTKDGTFDIYPIEVGSTSTQALQIPNGEKRDDNDLFYWVEFRNPDLAKFVVGKGDGLHPELGPGVHINVAPDFRDTGDVRPLLLDLAPGSPGDHTDPRLTAGRSFDDPDGRVTIRVLSVQPEKAVVQVTFPNGGSGENKCNNTSTSRGTRLFAECDYDGAHASLNPGVYQAADLAALGIADKSASSLSLEPGYEADLFEGDNLTGRTITLTASESCFVFDNFNDVLSSIRIRAVDAGGGSGPGEADAGAADAGSAGAGGGEAGSGGAAGETGGSEAGAAEAGAETADAASGSGGNGAGTGRGGDAESGSAVAEPDDPIGCACQAPGSKKPTPDGSVVSFVLAGAALTVFRRRRGTGVRGVHLPNPKARLRVEILPSIPARNFRSAR